MHVCKFFGSRPLVGRLIVLSFLWTQAPNHSDQHRKKRNYDARIISRGLAYPIFGRLTHAFPCLLVWRLVEIGRLLRGRRMARSGGWIALTILYDCR